MQVRFFSNVLACTLLVACGLTVFLLLIPIPQSLAIDMPKDLHCSYFAANRRGWGCARFGNVMAQPLAVFASMLISLLCGAWLNWSLRVPIGATLVLTWGFFTGLAGLLGAVYFIQGHARLSYGALSMLELCTAACGFLLLQRITNKRFATLPVDPKRREALDRGISIEIAERNAEKRTTSHGKPRP